MIASEKLFNYTCASTGSYSIFIKNESDHMHMPITCSISFEVKINKIQGMDRTNNILQIYLNIGGSMNIIVNLLDEQRKFSMMQRKKKT